MSSAFNGNPLLSRSWVSSNGENVTEFFNLSNSRAGGTTTFFVESGGIPLVKFAFLAIASHTKSAALRQAEASSRKRGDSPSPRRSASARHLVTYTPPFVRPGKTV